jgi:uncharacterized protein (TIGR02996 family)
MLHAIDLKAASSAPARDRQPMHSLDVLLSAITADPGDDTAWVALADCLEEQGQTDSAELVRLREWLRHAAYDDPDRPPREQRLQSLLLSGVLPVLPRRTVMVSQRTRLELALIPAGSFIMGSPEEEQERQGDEGPQHRVTLTRAFYLGVYPVTQSQWRAVMGSNPSTERKADHPVSGSSWNRCQTFCNKLTEQTGLKFRLPTEAEWEYAARATTTTPFHFGATISADIVNFDGNYCYRGQAKGIYRAKTTVVGSFPPNAFGLYDMHGNVWELCQDGLREYTEEPVSDPVGLEKEYRAARGGSWFHLPWHCRCAYRIHRGVDNGDRYIGLRVCAECD